MNPDPISPQLDTSAQVVVPQAEAATPQASGELANNPTLEVLENATKQSHKRRKLWL